MTLWFHKILKLYGTAKRPFDSEERYCEVAHSIHLINQAHAVTEIRCLVLLYAYRRTHKALSFK
jgi:hypothetical protein